MKVKLLRKVRRAAINCAHINSITTTSDWRGEYISGVSVGFGIYDNEPYKNIWTLNMDKDTFNRLVRQKYWELNKEYYYKKYRK